MLMKENAEQLQSDKRRWRLREQASFDDVLAFLGCMADIMDAFDTIRELHPSDPMRCVFVARRVSVALRKMMLDGNGNLLKTCLTEARIHPLKPPVSGARQVEAVQKLKAVEGKAVFENEGKESVFDAPQGEHRITIDPLFGVLYEDGGIFAMESPFDLAGEPIKFKSCVNGRGIQVGEIVFRAADLLRLIANKEGAHIEHGHKLMLPDASTLMMESRDAKYEAINALKFGGLSYAQIFCMFTALYVIGQAKELLDEARRRIDNGMVSRFCDRIGECRTTLVMRGSFASESYRVFVTGSDLEPNMDSVGDYYATTVKIP